MRKFWTISILILLVASVWAAPPRETQRELRAAFEDSLWIMHATAQTIQSARTAQEAARALYGYRMDMQPLTEKFERYARLQPAGRDNLPPNDALGKLEAQATEAFQAALLEALTRFGNDPEFQAALLQFQAEPAPGEAETLPGDAGR